MKPDAIGSARGKCPICGRLSAPGYRPFCSRRCADVDLARWLSGAYAIPDRGEGEEAPPESEDGETGTDKPGAGRSQ
jgi:uncharacterized protein